ncbi:MAG: phosphoribosylformylglycinamidine synthase, partial [Deltaproteobacteria bacterium]|nr:phosphoribosylformylglycinamidine synthase [Deltaproteobacteria bacterium]
TKISIPPTLLFSTMGKIDDVRKAVTMDAKKPGDLVYVLGVTRAELGGSEWFALHGFIGNAVPQVDAQGAQKLYRALGRAIETGLVASCHDCSDGGLGVALAEVAFAGGVGVDIALSLVPREEIERDDYLLFSESQSRFVVTVSPEAREGFEKIMAGNICACVGKVSQGKTLRIIGIHGTTIIEEDIDSLKEAWQKPLDF